MGEEVAMDREVCFRIMNTGSPNIVVPGNLAELMAWLLAEKLVNINPNAGDLEIAAVLATEDLQPLAGRIMEETSRDARWQVAGRNWFSEMARSGFAGVLKGGEIPEKCLEAYNQLRERMGLPPWTQQAGTGRWEG